MSAPKHSQEADFNFETLNVGDDGAVLFVEISTSPMNLLGPELFIEGTRTNEFRQLIAAAMHIGFQTRAAEMNLAQLVYEMHGKTDV